MSDIPKLTVTVPIGTRVVYKDGLNKVCVGVIKEYLIGGWIRLYCGEHPEHGAITELVQVGQIFAIDE